MTRSNKQFLAMIAVSIAIHSVLIIRLGGPEAAPSARAETILVTLSPPPIEEPPPPIEVTPEPEAPQATQPLVETVTDEQDIPPMDSSHEIPIMEFTPMASTAEPSPAGVRPAGASNEAVVIRWLERHKQYPRVALVRRIEGEVLLHLELDAEGNVLLSEIARSSGRAGLDGEVLAMVKRAQPFPLLQLGETKFDFYIPIDFTIE